MRLADALRASFDRSAGRAGRDEGAIAVRLAIEKTAKKQKCSSDQLETIIYEVLSKTLSRDIATQLRESNPGVDADALDSLCGSYLRKMVRNAIADAYDPHAAPDEAPEVAVADEAPLGDIEKPLELASAHAIESRAPRYRETLQTAIRQVLDLGMGRRSMDEVLAEAGVTSASPNFVLVRDQHYTAHKRARQELEKAAIDLGAKGRLTPDEVDTVISIVRQQLCRCQRSKP